MFMSPIRLARDLRDLSRGLVELLTVSVDGEDASYEIAVSARRFSANAQAAVDDKLNFSATLMRAGEVEAANRLLKEFHDDVREEEVALIERVNEVKAAEAVRREGMTRVRLARMLAVAIIGSGLLSFSAAGMALASLLRERAAELAQVASGAKESDDRVLSTRLAAQRARDNKLRPVRIGRLKLMLSAAELRTIRELAGGTVDESGLQELISLLPRQLAEKVQEAVVVANDVAEETQDAVAISDVPSIKTRLKRKARQAKAEAAAQREEEPTPEPSPSDQEDDDDVTPPSDDEDSGGGGGGGGDGSSGDDDEGQLPIMDDGDDS